MTTHWYALYSKALKEAILWEQVSVHPIESYYPCIHVQPVNPRAHKTKPYFPRYVFGHLDWEQVSYSILQWMPGGTGIVSSGGTPSPIPDNLMGAIKRRVDEINMVGGQVFHGLKRGDIVTVREGSFRGYGAIFDARISGEERVRVLLRLLSSRQVPWNCRPY